MERVQREAENVVVQQEQRESSSISMQPERRDPEKDVKLLGVVLKKIQKMRSIPS